MLSVLFFHLLRMHRIIIMVIGTTPKLLKFEPPFTQHTPVYCMAIRGHQIACGLTWKLLPQMMCNVIGGKDMISVWQANEEFLCGRSTEAVRHVVSIDPKAHVRVAVG